MLSQFILCVYPCVCVCVHACVRVGACVHAIFLVLMDPERANAEYAPLVRVRPHLSHEIASSEESLLQYHVHVFLQDVEV